MRYKAIYAADLFADVQMKGIWDLTTHLGEEGSQRIVDYEKTWSHHKYTTVFHIAIGADR